MNEFIHFIEVKKDAMGVAWCTGTGVLFRRSVIEEIGGWPVGSLAEDVLCSSMMHAKGYKTAYIHEWIQCGLVPDTIAGREYLIYLNSN
jgi:cellulose synthase/poly-beta-1,6-N-acetylglucosamine synthase-like glycosyltransferase